MISVVLISLNLGLAEHRVKGSRGAQGQGGPAWSGDSAHPLAPGSQGQDCKRLCKPEGKCRYCFPGRREAGWWHFALSVEKRGISKMLSHRNVHVVSWTQREFVKNPKAGPNRTALLWVKGLG